jgi:hypothetical protein
MYVVGGFMVPVVRIIVELDSPYQVSTTARATSVSEKLPTQHGAWQKTLKDEVILNRVQKFSLYIAKNTPYSSQIQLGNFVYYELLRRNKYRNSS